MTHVPARWHEACSQFDISPFYKNDHALRFLKTTPTSKSRGRIVNSAAHARICDEHATNLRPTRGSATAHRKPSSATRFAVTLIRENDSFAQRRNCPAQKHVDTLS